LGGPARVGSEEYAKPTVTGVSPGSGALAGGTSVTVVGEGFAVGTSGTIFKFGSTPATSVSCSSTTACTMLTPSAHKAGKVDVRASVGASTSAKNPSADHFTYG
jgi:IPT/TIG domain-containing protein